MDLGAQPMTNRFLSSKEALEYTHPLSIGLCRSCLVVQLVGPPPPVEIKSRFEWLTYNEPEKHLDDLAQAILGLPGLTSKSVVAGVTFKDRSLLERLRNLNGMATVQLDPRTDFGINDPLAGLETLQELLNPALANKIVEKRGKFDVVVVRHMLEHVHALKPFIAAIKTLVKMNGYVVLEVPDCKRALAGKDYSMIWEEHVSYFTEMTLKSFLNYHNIDVITLQNHPYPLENSLIVIGKIGSAEKSGALSQQKDMDETSLFKNFVNGFAEVKRGLHLFLKEFQKNHGRLAILGAGHLSCMFINILDLKNYFEFVVDDNIHKTGLFMPGSHLPIVASQELVRKKIKLCLLGVNPENEDRLIQTQKEFVANGGTFASIFPGSSRSLMPRIFS
ncbi:MAG: hypothetical protein KCHDKBKB_01838 [Elusimicrobia bacterium]|nr:hypothetical protein [Elusimicrobiota bacterium]